MNTGLQTTALLLLTAVTLMAVAGAVGIPDNPPGLALMYLGTVVGVTAFVHRWTEPYRFLYMFFGSAVAFAVFVFLHNIGYALATNAGSDWARGLWNVMGVGAFLLAVVVAPATFVVGGVGALVAWLRRRG